MVNMYAVIESGGKQHRVTPGEDVALEKLPGKVGDSVSFDKVLLTSDGDNISVGKPYLENVTVEGHIAHHDRQRKIVVFKYKKRKNYRRKRGHRQHFTLVRIDDIKA
jgi:large subunit ribosomal protein L21